MLSSPRSGGSRGAYADRVVGAEGRPAWGAVGATLLAVTLSACSSGARPASPSVRPGPVPSLRADIGQQRRDVVLERVEVELENTGPEEVVVERLLLRVPGYAGAGPVPKDSPVPPGQVVNLPTPYGDVECGPAGRAAVGRPVVVLDLRTASDPVPRRITVRPADPDGLLAQIADRACTVERLAREVTLSLGTQWRPRRARGDVVLHGTLEATLTIDEPRVLTQVAGSVIYGLRPEQEVAPPDVLATLTPDRPTASVPIEIYPARCDGHAIGETKQPYLLVAVLAEPGGEESTVPLTVDDATVAALQRVCRL